MENESLEKFYFRSSDDFLQQAIVASQFVKKRFRKSPIPRERWNQSYLTNLAIEENSFVREVGLSPQAFNRLCFLLQAPLRVDSQRSAAASPRSDPISLESRVFAALSELKGARRIETMRTHGVASSTAYKNFQKVVMAINAIPELAIQCDMSQQAQLERSQAFEKLSTSGLFKYCTGAIDGIALTTIAPPRSKFLNQAQFHSGSKKKNCINMQAVCDAELKFLAISVQHTGCTNDSEAFDTSSLKDLCNLHVFPLHWLGDNAYTLTESMIVPFAGINHETDPHLESFNFYQSQIRITIERTFGVFIRRWGIFSHANRYDIRFFFQIIHAAARLHNFCINNSVPLIPTRSTGEISVAVDDNGRLMDSAWQILSPAGFPSQDSDMRIGSTLREHIVEILLNSPNLQVLRSHNQ